DEPEGRRFDAGAGAEDGYALAGMVGAGRGRIVAVVGGDDRQIAGAEPGEKRGKPGIEGLECARIARDVARMAPERVEIDKVGKAEVAVPGLLQGVDRRIEEREVVGPLAGGGDAAPGEDVGDLADGVGAPAGGDDTVEERGFGGRDREIAPV